MILGGFEVRFLAGGSPRHCPNQEAIFAGGEFCVCDGAHRLGVMKSPKGGLAGGIPLLEQREKWGTLGGDVSRRPSPSLSVVGEIAI
jgi:hypothetical protein